MSEGKSTGSRGRTIASAAAALLLAAGVAGIGFGLAHGTQAADQTTAVAMAPAPAPISAPPPASSRPSGEQTGLQDQASTTAPPVPPAAPSSDTVLPTSVPVRLQAPSIGVDTPLIQLDKQPDGEVAVPPGAPGSPAGWYTGSVAPGVTGSSVVLGHVNAIGSPVGVFYRLHELPAGSQVTVLRADHTAAVFAVDRVDVYHKSTFPTVDVYRNADRAELRLITCGGYDAATGEYLDNTVVYAHLVSSHPA